LVKKLTTLRRAHDVVKDWPNICNRLVSHDTALKRTIARGFLSG